MIAASSIGIFLIPMLYVEFQTMRERAKARFGGKPVPRPAADARRCVACAPRRARLAFLARRPLHILRQRRK